MKKLLLVFVTFLIVAVSTASAPVNSSPGNKKIYASEVFIPIGNTGTKISLLELSTISTAGLEELTGNKMNFLERRSFFNAQKKIKRGIDSDGVVTKKQLKKLYYDGIDGTTGFHLGGFALGLFLGPIGVLIAYLINDGKKTNRVKWAWVGFGVVVLIYLLALV